MKAGKNTVKVVGAQDGQEYTDEAEWIYIKVESPLFEIHEDTDTLMLPSWPVDVRDVSNAILCNVECTKTVYAADGETVLTEGTITEGMKLLIVTENGEFWYTFVRNNLALQATAKATFSQSSCPASMAVDGNRSTRWSSYGSTSLPQGIQLDLGQSYGLSSLEILWFGEGRTYTYDVYVTENPVLSQSSYPTPTLHVEGSSRYGSASGLPDDAPYTVLKLPKATKGRYVTIVVTSGSGIAYTVALWEIGVYRLSFDMETISQVVAGIEQIGEITSDNFTEKLLPLRRLNKRYKISQPLMARMSKQLFPIWTL